MKRLIVALKNIRRSLSLWSAKYYLGPTQDAYWERFKTRENQALSEWQRLESKPYKKSSAQYQEGSNVSNF